MTHSTIDIADDKETLYLQMYISGNQGYQIEG